jgi:hypothetical protein
LFEYNLKFDEGFPSYQLLRWRSEEESIAIVKRCIDEGKTAYQLGLVSDDEDLEY